MHGTQGMTMIASIHLPPEASSGYVRVEIDGETVGYLRANMYDQVFKDEAAFREALQVPGAEEEAHSKPGLNGSCACSVRRRSRRCTDTWSSESHRRLTRHERTTCVRPRLERGSQTGVPSIAAK